MKVARQATRSKAIEANGILRTRLEKVSKGPSGETSALINPRGIGTLVNGRILDTWGFGALFIFAAILILLAGIIAAVLLRRITPIAASCQCVFCGYPAKNRSALR